MEKADYYTTIVREIIDDILKYHYKPDLKCSLWKGPYYLPRCLMICEELLSKIANDEDLTQLL